MWSLVQIVWFSGYNNNVGNWIDNFVARSNFLIFTYFDQVPGNVFITVQSYVLLTFKIFDNL